MMKAEASKLVDEDGTVRAECADEQTAEYLSGCTEAVDNVRELANCLEALRDGEQDWSRYHQALQDAQNLLNQLNKEGQHGSCD